MYPRTQRPIFCDRNGQYNDPGVEPCHGLGLTEKLDSFGVELTKEQADSFKGLGCLTGEYKVKLDLCVSPNWSSMQHATVFSKLDVNSGYRQLRHAQESSKSCTFNVCMGVSTSSQPVKYSSE